MGKAKAKATAKSRKTEVIKIKHDEKIKYHIRKLRIWGKQRL